MKSLLGGVVLCIWFSTSVAAQGFAALMERLEAFEQRLSQIETTRSVAGAGLQQLQREVDTARQRADIAAGLGQRFAALEQQVVQVSNAVEQLELSEGEPGPDIQGLAMELSTLTGELRRVIAQGVETPVPDINGLPALEMSGFGDFCNLRSRRDGVAGRYEIGQVEVGLSALVDTRLGVDMAIAYDGEGFSLGAFTTDFRLLGQDDSHFYHSDALESMGIVAGQFDVPFGIDWRVYPSVDRLLISTPLVVEGTHEAWNDYGVQSYVQTRHINAVAYLVNGADIAAADMAVGGRIGWNAGQVLEVGLSLAGFFVDDERRNADLLGVDAVLQLGALAAKGEYIRHSAREDDSRGFYAQAVWDFGRYFAVGRYGFFTRDSQDAKRVSTGLGWRIVEACQVRSEYQINSNAANMAIGQLVVSF